MDNIQLIFAYAYNLGFIKDTKPPFLTMEQLSRRDAWSLHVFITKLRSKRSNKLTEHEVTDVQDIIHTTRKILKSSDDDVFETTPLAC